MRMTLRHVRFLWRGVALYNVQLICLNGRPPRQVPTPASYPAAADHRRRRAHSVLGAATADASRVRATCGRCCLGGVDRFTPFDQMVRARATTPAPSASRRIYSMPWMIANGVGHFLEGRLTRRPEKPAACRYLSPNGCTLSRHERPMICVSWFCPTLVLATHPARLDQAEGPLREILALHREGVSRARAACRGRIPQERTAEHCPPAHAGCHREREGAGHPGDEGQGRPERTSRPAGAAPSPVSARCSEPLGGQHGVDP